MSRLAFGITAATRGHHPELGAALERLGYHELWVNDTPRGDGISALAAVAPGTSVLRFGVGVVALSQFTASDIAARVQARGVPVERLTVGVGSGSSASLGLVAEGVAHLRELLPGTPLAVAAVGPRMARLAGEVANAVVANWALPDRLAWLRERIAEGAQAAGRPEPRLVAYVRTAVGPEAEQRLRREMDRYRRYGGGHYARAFDDQPGQLVGVAVETGDPSTVSAMLAPYRSVVDTLVVRGLPEHDVLAGWLEIAHAAARPGQGMS